MGVQRFQCMNFGGQKHFVHNVLLTHFHIHIFLVFYNGEVPGEKINTNSSPHVSLTGSEHSEDGARGRVVGDEVREVTVTWQCEIPRGRLWGGGDGCRLPWTWARNCSQERDCGSGHHWFENFNRLPTILDVCCTKLRGGFDHFLSVRLASFLLEFKILVDP